MSHFPPSPLFFVYVEEMCTHKKAKSFWWMLINLVSWFKCLFFSLAHCVSGVTNPSKQSSQLEHLSVQITVWTHSYLFWMMLNSTHSSGKTHPYDTQTCYVTAVTRDCALLVVPFTSTKHRGEGLQTWRPFASVALVMHDHHLRDFQAVLE